MIEHNVVYIPVEHNWYGKYETEFDEQFEYVDLYFILPLHFAESKVTKKCPHHIIGLLSQCIGLLSF